MKRFIVFFITITISLVGLSQVELDSVISSKTYDNGSHIVYMQLQSAVGRKYRKIIERKLTMRDDISRFSFNDKSDFSQVMFKGEANVTPDIIIDKMNRIIYEQNNLTEKRIPFTEVEDYGNYRKVKFHIDGVDDETQIESLLYESAKDVNIFSVNVDDTYLCVMTIGKNVKPVYIHRMLTQLGMHMSGYFPD